jgi:flagellar biosynthetic protein FlhB
MSEDRTQPPSKRRRQVARQHGQAAHSPELTAAAGWLAAVVLLGLAGDNLTIALTGLVRGSLSNPTGLPDDASAVAARVRNSILGVAWPLAAILGGFAAAAFAAHQLQVRGLWATSQIVPDPSRLWRFSKGPGPSTLFVQSTWALAKGIILVSAAACVLGAGWSDFLHQSSLEGPRLAQAAGGIVLRVSWCLAGVLLALGLVDYVLRYRRFEAMLRTTPAEQREDQQVMEGDPAARAQRRRAARSMRGDSPELLAGAAWLLAGPRGLTLVIAGGPPPRRVSIRSVAKGATGLRLRRLAEANGIPRVDDGALAQRLARRPASVSALAAELIANLAAIWPGPSAAASV